MEVQSAAVVRAGTARNCSATASEAQCCSHQRRARWGGAVPHLHRDWAHPCHICPGTGLCRSYASSVLPLYPLTLLGTVSDQHGLPLRTRGTRLMVADAVCSPP